MRCRTWTLICLGLLPLLARGMALADESPRATSLIPSPSVRGAEPPASGAGPIVVLNTSLGEIRIRLFPDRAPISVENFLSYVDNGFYNGTIFHRVSEGYVIQGGGFTANF